MTVKELAVAYGMTTQVIFANAYARYGLLYGLGGPKETHARYLQAGVIPAYVARYCKDLQKLPRPEQQLELPL